MPTTRNQPERPESQDRDGAGAGDGDGDGAGDDRAGRHGEPPGAEHAPQEGRQGGRTRHGRRLAEWVSLGVSLAVLLGAAGFLIHEALQTPDDAMPIVATVQTDRATIRGDRHVVPIEIRNDGSQTARDVKVKIAHRTRDGQWAEQDLVIDYLAEGSSQTIYVYLDRPSREAELFAEPQQYRLE